MLKHPISILSAGAALLSASAVMPLAAQTWTGAVSEDWFEGGNWAAGAPPPAGCGFFGCTGVTIAEPGKPAAIAGNTASLGPNSSITVDGGGHLILRQGGVLELENGGRAGFQQGGEGRIDVLGAGSRFSVVAPSADAIYTLGFNGSGTLMLADGGEFRLAAASGGRSGILQMGSGATGVGTLIIGDGGAAGVLTADQITVGPGQAIINFNHNEADYRFDFNLNDSTSVGSFSVNQLGSGRTVLAGNNNYRGDTRVMNGTLVLGGGIPNSAVTIGNGGTLALGDGAPGVIEISNLVIEQGGTLHFDLAAPDGDALPGDLLAPGSVGDFLVVGNNLTLNDATLNVNDLDGFNNGIYTLIQYGGGITGDFAQVNLPDGFGGTLQLGQYNGNDVLYLDVGGTLGDEVYWDGANPGAAPNGSVDGGDGVWNNSTASWTNANGSAQGAWNEQVAIFSGTPGTVTVAEDVRYTGMTFLSDGYTLAAGGGQLLPNGDALEPGVSPQLLVEAGVTATVEAPFAGDRGLAKDGAGTLVLNGDNLHTGITSLQNGRLHLGDGSSSGSLVGNVNIARGTLAFNRSDDWLFAPLVSGSGNVEQMGSGTTRFDRAQTYTGNTVVSGGTLQLDDGGSLAAASAVQLNGGTLAINRSDALTLANSLSGTGTLLQRGSGTTTLTANAGGFAGTTRISNGVLQLDGTLGGDAEVDGGRFEVLGSFLGTVNVNDGGTLAGTGTVAGLDVHSGGRLDLAPIADVEGSGGVLTVDGDARFAEGAELRVGVNRFGDADRLQVNGTATLEGGSVLAVEAGAENAGLWNPLSTYTILSADTLSGTFDDVSSNFAFLDASLNYEANTVQLRLERNDIDYAAVGVTANQQGTGAAVQSLGFAHPLASAVLPLTAEDARAAFDQLSGELHASVKTQLFEDSRFIRDTLLARGRTLDADDATGLWAQLLGATGSTDAGNGSAELTRDSAGVFLGGDHLRGERLRLGWSAGYTRGNGDLDAQRAESETDNIHLGLYGASRYAAPAWRGADASLGLQLGGAYTWHEVSTQRQIDFPGYQEQLAADYDGTSSQLFAELDYRLRWTDLELAPFFGLAWVRQSMDGFFEGDQYNTPFGETATLMADQGSESLSYASLGLRAATALPGWDGLRLDGALGWRQALDERQPETRLHFLDGDERFTVQGAPVAESVALVDLGLVYQWWDAGELALSYAGQFSSEANDHTLRFGLRLRLD